MQCGPCTTARAVFSRLHDGDTSMNKFYAELDEIRDAGGRWKDSKRGDGTLKTVFIQTKTMEILLKNTIKW